MILGLDDLDDAETAATTAAQGIIADVVQGPSEEEKAEMAAAMQAKEDYENEEIENVYEVIAEMFQPVVYDRSMGWKGQTFLEAMDFCSQTAQGAARTICPLTGKPVCVMFMDPLPKCFHDS
jgi:hypothetical protein